MADESHFKQGKWDGVFFKYESKVYRDTCEGCGRGYHGNRWDAHHILPAVSFGQITEEFPLDCLRVTPFNINEAYAMGGMPKLTAYILYFQDKMKVTEAQRLSEKTITMQRWGKVGQYKSQLKMTITMPDNLPVHNPCNWGHVEYSEDVFDYLSDKVFKPLKEKKPHPDPQSVKSALETAVTKFWGDLVAFGKRVGGGGLKGVEQNFLNRYGTAADGWWKPMLMSKRASEPASPGMQ